MVPPTSISPGQACGVGFALSTIGSLVWDAEERPIKNRELDGALSIGGRGSTGKNKNQTGVGVRGGKDFGEEARKG